MHDCRLSAVPGTGSLFELLCTVQTRTGEKTLASWLLEPAAPDELRARQEAVVELRSRLDLREDLSLLAGRAGSAATGRVSRIDKHPRRDSKCRRKWTCD